MASTPPTPSTPPLVLTVPEAAAELQIDRTRIYDLIRDGSLVSFTIGKSRRISRDALQRYIHTREYPDDQPSPKLRAARRRAQRTG